MTTCFEQWLRHSGSFVVICCLTVLLAVGCDSKRERFELSGTVTYKGAPVPAGYMVISPDEKSGNKGPGTSASIVDGRYATLRGRGTIGGPHVVSVFGFDGKEYTMPGQIANPMGKPLCKSDVRADLPNENGTFEIVVPAKSH